MRGDRDSSRVFEEAREGLAGVRVMVVGSGDVLARVLGTLHRLGAMCVAVEDPYRAVLELAGSGGASGANGSMAIHAAEGGAMGEAWGGYEAVVLALPCLFAGEIGVVGAIVGLQGQTGRPKVLVAAAEQQLSMLTAAIREGASGVVTERGVEWLEVARPVRVERSEPAVKESAEEKEVEEFRLPAQLLVEEEETVAVEAETNDSEEFEEADEHFDEGFEPIDPLLTADELRALLSDVPEPLGDTGTTGRTRGHGRGSN